MSGSGRELLHSIVSSAINVLQDPRPGVSTDGDDFQSVLQSTRNAFRRRPRTSMENGQVKRGRRRADLWKLHTFLLRRANVDFFPTKNECIFLTSSGLGKPKSGQLTTRRSISLADFDEILCGLYPEMPLSLVGFTYGKCGKGRRIQKLNPSSVENLEKILGKGTLLLLPIRDLPVPTPAILSVPATPILSVPATSILSVPAVGLPNLPVLATPSTSSSNTEQGNDRRTHEIENTDSSDDDLPMGLLPQQNVLREVREVDIPITVHEVETPPMDIPIITNMEDFVIEAFSVMPMPMMVVPEEIRVNRQSIVKDLLDLYSSDVLVNKTLKVEFIGEEGDDFGGLLKEMFTIFWQNVSNEFFRGEIMKVPFLPLHRLRKESDTLVLLGRILSHMISLTRTLPTVICRVAYLAIGDMHNPPTKEMMMSDFMHYITTSERRLVTKALNQWSELTSSERERLSSFFTVHDLYENPREDEILDQIYAIAHEHLVNKPKGIYSLMRKGIPEMHLPFWKKLTPDHLSCIFLAQQPTAARVMGCLKACEEDLSNEQEAVFYYLQEFVSELSLDDLSKFLLFVTGSIHMPQGNIHVSFNRLVEEQRRPIAHTCSNVLELSVAYSTYQEFRREMQTYLHSEYSYEYSSL